tara:strand:- start:2700 stop:3104 length:405 start_codon:yes stop_codon:yes gene_type:complete
MPLNDLADRMKDITPKYKTKPAPTPTPSYSYRSHTPWYSGIGEFISDSIEAACEGAKAAAPYVLVGALTLGGIGACIQENEKCRRAKIQASIDRSTSRIKARQASREFDRKVDKAWGGVKSWYKERSNNWTRGW